MPGTLAFESPDLLRGLYGVVTFFVGAFTTCMSSIRNTISSFRILTQRAMNGSNSLIRPCVVRRGVSKIISTAHRFMVCSPTRHRREQLEHVPDNGNESVDNDTNEGAEEEGEERSHFLAAGPQTQIRPSRVRFQSFVGFHMNHLAWEIVSCYLQNVCDDGRSPEQLVGRPPMAAVYDAPHAVNPHDLDGWRLASVLHELNEG